MNDIKQLESIIKIYNLKISFHFSVNCAYKVLMTIIIVSTLAFVIFTSWIRTLQSRRCY